MKIMIEIKFKGKKKSDNSWVIGDLNHINGKTFIFDRSHSLNSTDDYEVYPITVTQLSDGKDIVFYQRRNRTLKSMVSSLAMGMTLFVVIAYAGWSNSINESKINNNHSERIESQSKTIDSLIIERDHYKNAHLDHFNSCVEGKVLTDYEDKLIRKIKNR